MIIINGILQLCSNEVFSEFNVKVIWIPKLYFGVPRKSSVKMYSKLVSFLCTCAMNWVEWKVGISFSVLLNVLAFESSYFSSLVFCPCRDLRPRPRATNQTQGSRPSKYSNLLGQSLHRSLLKTPTSFLILPFLLSLNPFQRHPRLRLQPPYTHNTRMCPEVRPQALPMLPVAWQYRLLPPPSRPWSLVGLARHYSSFHHSLDVLRHRERLTLMALAWCNHRSLRTTRRSHFLGTSKYVGFPLLWMTC